MRPPRTRHRIEQVRRDNVGLQFDVFHAQRTEGNLVETIRTRLPLIRHVQIADCPGRGEPGTGEIRFSCVLGELERAGYRGAVGLEYRPTTTTEESFAWMQETRS